MKIFKKNYVGINREREDFTDAPLAFLTPYEDNAAGRKRQDSIKSWLHGWYNDDKESDKKETRIVDNIPRSGFKVVDVADRWTTQNKWARIVDPNGYELEISIANLIDIMLHGIVEHGVIKEECIWGREGPHNRLIPVNSSLYRNALQEGQKLTQAVGDVVVGQHNKRYVYLGTGYIQWLAYTGNVDKVAEPNRGTMFSRRYYDMSLVPTGVSTFTSPKVKHLYYLIKGDDRWDHAKLVERAKPMKITHVEENIDVSEFGKVLYSPDNYKSYYPEIDVWDPEYDPNLRYEHYESSASLVRFNATGKWTDTPTVTFMQAETARLQAERSW